MMMVWLWCSVRCQQSAQEARRYVVAANIPSSSSLRLSDNCAWKTVLFCCSSYILSLPLPIDRIFNNTSIYIVVPAIYATRGEML